MPPFLVFDCIIFHKITFHSTIWFSLIFSFQSNSKTITKAFSTGIQLISCMSAKYNLKFWKIPSHQIERGIGQNKERDSVTDN